MNYFFFVITSRTAVEIILANYINQSEFFFISFFLSILITRAFTHSYHLYNISIYFILAHFVINKETSRHFNQFCQDRCEKLGIHCTRLEWAEKAEKMNGKNFMSIFSLLNLLKIRSKQGVSKTTSTINFDKRLDIQKSNNTPTDKIPMRPTIIINNFNYFCVWKHRVIVIFIDHPLHYLLYLYFMISFCADYSIHI